jgi:Domain of unknown function (DUF4259)
MSIWGASPAENDDAADWLSEFSEEPSIGALTEAFNDVLDVDSDDYIEVGECAISVAAAAVVRDLFSTEGPEYLLDEECMAVLRSLSKKLAPGARVSLVKKAQKSVRRIMQETERSELSQLMQEDVSLHKVWSQNMDDLNQVLDEIQKGLK